MYRCIDAWERLKRKKGVGVSKKIRKKKVDKTTLLCHRQLYGGDQYWVNDLIYSAYGPPKIGSGVGKVVFR